MCTRQEGSLLLAPLRKGRHKLKLLGALSGYIAGLFNGASDGFWC